MTDHFSSVTNCNPPRSLNRPAPVSMSKSKRSHNYRRPTGPVRRLRRSLGQFTATSVDVTHALTLETPSPPSSRSLHERAFPSAQTSTSFRSSSLNTRPRTVTSVATVYFLRLGCTTDFIKPDASNELSSE